MIIFFPFHSSRCTTWLKNFSKSEEHKDAWLRWRVMLETLIPKNLQGKDETVSWCTSSLTKKPKLTIWDFASRKLKVPFDVTELFRTSQSEGKGAIFHFVVVALCYS